MAGKVIDNASRFVRIKEEALDNALERMAKDIVTVAKIRVPYKRGNLQKEIKPVKKGKLNHIVLANKEYASYQEKGQRADGSHKVRRYTTPGTGKGFLVGAGNSITEQAINYLKQANNQFKV